MNNMQLVNFILIYLPFCDWVQPSRQLSPPMGDGWRGVGGEKKKKSGEGEDASGFAVTRPDLL